MVELYDGFVVHYSINDGFSKCLCNYQTITQKIIFSLFYRLFYNYNYNEKTNH